MNLKRWILSIIGFVSLFCFIYIRSDFEPVFYNTGWFEHRWICYPYATYLLLWIIYKVYSILRESIVSMFSLLGRASYEICLLQMIFTTINYSCFCDIDNKYIIMSINILLSWSTSIFFGIQWYRFKLKYKEKL